MLQNKQDDLSENGFGHRLERLLSENNLSQQEFGNMIGVAQNTISGYIKGKHLPDLSVLAKICHVLHVRSDYLLGLSLYQEVNPPHISVRESQLLNTYGQLTTRDRDFLLEEAHMLKRKQDYHSST